MLSVYLDPGVEEPWRRKFDLDPVFYCQENRLEMVAAILTILRAGQQMGRATKDRTGSFETWSDLIRPAVMLIGDLGLLDVADPVDSINNAFAQDPAHVALGQLLETWDMEFDEEAKTLSEVIERARHNNTKGDTRLLRVLSDIAEDHGQVNAKRLGHWIRKYRGRLVDGLKIEEVGVRNNTKLYRVFSQNGDVGDVGDVFGSSRNSKSVTPLFSGKRKRTPTSPTSPDSPKRAVLPEPDSCDEEDDRWTGPDSVVIP